MKAQLKKLKSGLPVVLIPLQGTKTLTLLIMVKTGSKYEDRRTSGLSHFVEHMFFKGTHKRPNTLLLSSELDALGGNFNAFTGKEYTGYYVKADSRHLDKASELLSDMLFNSKFDSEEIEREKGTIIEELNMYESNPLMHIEDVFENCLYGDTPAGWDTIGTIDTIKSFKREDFIEYLQSQYGSKSFFVCLAGNFKANKALPVIQKYFGLASKNKFRDKIKVVEKQNTPALKIKTKDIDQVNLSLGVRTFPLGHKDEFVAKLIAVILGGSMSSRLFIELRERQGLAYTVRTQVETYTDSGYLTTFAGVPKDKLELALSIILREYKKIGEQGVGAKELKRAKDLIAGRLAIQLEASDAVANWYARQVTLRNKILSPEEFLKKIKQIQDKDIRRVAKNIFVNKGLNLALIGPIKDQEKIKKILHF